MSFPLKRWLERNKFYLRCRYSPIVLRIWLALRPSVRRKLHRQRRFYHSLLRNSSPGLVIDVGANEGFVTQALLDAGHRVIAVEPSPRNLAILEARFGRNPDVIILPGALSDSEGAINFYQRAGDHALGTVNEEWKEASFEKNAAVAEVRATTLDVLINAHGVPVFIKIDVEGHEKRVMNGLNQPIDIISFEAMLPVFLGATRSCIHRLMQLNPKTIFNYAIDDRIVLPQAVSGEEIGALLHAVAPQTIEVIAFGK